jgi:hypothetical protein
MTIVNRSLKGPDQSNPKMGKMGADAPLTEVIKRSAQAVIVESATGAVRLMALNSGSNAEATSN